MSVPGGNPLPVSHLRRVLQVAEIAAAVALGLYIGRQLERATHVERPNPWWGIEAAGGTITGPLTLMDADGATFLRLSEGQRLTSAPSHPLRLECTTAEPCDGEIRSLVIPLQRPTMPDSIKNVKRGEVLP